MATTEPILKRPRRMVLQLTPLLDLLLIVIFAQYLDVGDRDRSREQELTLARREATAAMQRAATAESERQAALSDARRSARAAEQAATRLDGFLDVAAEMFALPPETQQRLLSGAAGTPEEIAAMRSRLTAVMSGDPAAVQLHLQTHEELRRHADIWRVHLDADGRVHLRAGGRVETLAPLPDPGQIVPAVFAWSKRQPEPKSLVLVLFSYDEFALLQQVRGIRRAMPELRDRLRDDTTSRVDFADIGTQPL